MVSVDKLLGFVLVRRFHLEPAMEFRCFVRGSRLVGACQRHTADFFPFLAESRAQLSEQLDAFHDEHVADAFPHPDCAFIERMCRCLRADGCDVQTRMTCT